MKIFRLEPKNLNSHNWEASTYKDVVIVRAEDERRARERAKLDFLNADEIKSTAQPAAISPWSLGDHVDCKELNDSKYLIDGDEEILDPDPLDY
jgi:hypothetical protein